MSSTPAAAAALPEPESKPKARRKRIGRIRKLDKRVDRKPDGRYLIYYKPA